MSWIYKSWTHVPPPIPPQLPTLEEAWDRLESIPPTSSSIVPTFSTSPRLSMLADLCSRIFCTTLLDSGSKLTCSWCWTLFGGFAVPNSGRDFVVSELGIAWDGRFAAEPAVFKTININTRAQKNIIQTKMEIPSWLNKLFTEKISPRWRQKFNLKRWQK